MTASKRRDARIAVSALNFATGLTFASWASRIPDVRTNLALGDGELGTVLFAIPAGQLAMMAFSGYLVSRFGSCGTSIFSLTMYGVALMLISQAQTFASLFCALFLFGCMANMVNIAVNTQATALEGLYGRPIMSSLHAMWSLGGLAGGIIGAAFANTSLPIYTHYLAVAIVGISVAIIEGRHMLTNSVAGSAGKGKGVKMSAIDNTILLVGLMAFGGMFCEGIVYDWSSVYFATVVRPSDELVRLGYIAGMMAMTLGRLIGDRIVMRFGTANVLRTCGLLITFGVLLAVFCPYLVTSTIGFMMVGMGISSVVPTCYSLAGRHPQLPASIAITIVSSISFFGFMIGPPLIGLLSEASNLRIALGAVSVLGMIIVIVPRLIRDTLTATSLNGEQ